MRKLKKVCLSILLGIFTLTNVAFAAPQMPSDIKGHWAEADIKAAANEGWAYMVDGKFEPNKAATREEVVWMLIGKCNLLKPDGYDANKKADLSKYKDEPSAWAKDRMAAAIGNSYITGYPDNTIGAQNPITRAELAVLLSRLIKESVPATQLPFSDTIPGWAVDGIKKAYAMKIIQGYPDGTFGPNNNVTKAEALSMIKRWADGGKTSDEPVLSAEDEERIMSYEIPDGPFGRTNDQFKERISNYKLYLDVAKDYVQLHENYSYKDLSTESGKKKFLEGFEKYTPYDASYLKQLEKDIVSRIIAEKLIKEATFVTNDNCIFSDGTGGTNVRGVLYFKYLEIGKPLEGIFKDVKPGVQYKIDIELTISGRSDFTDPEQFQVTTCGYIIGSVPTEVK